MSASSSSAPPLQRSRIVSLYFMEHRAKLIDLAAFLDRVDRASDDLGHEDFRVAALRAALKILLDGQPDRARRVLESFSDHSADPIEVAPMKGALGAVEPGARDSGRVDSGAGPSGERGDA